MDLLQLFLKVNPTDCIKDRQTTLMSVASRGRRTESISLKFVREKATMNGVCDFC